MPQLSTPPQLVIFDCDGVLVDSEPTFNRVLHEFLLSCGADLSFTTCCDQFVGKSRHDVEQYLRDAGLLVPENWSVEFYKMALEALDKEVTPIKGAPDVVRRLMDANISICVASNGLMAKMHVTLGRTQLLPFFEGQMYSAYDIGNSKPAPDVFLHAAKINNTLPEHCVVIEDSASGFQAAANAGMACFAYCPNNDAADGNLYGAHAFNDMTMLPRLLCLH